MNRFIEPICVIMSSCLWESGLSEIRDPPIENSSVILFVVWFGSVMHGCCCYCCRSHISHETYLYSYILPYILYMHIVPGMLVACNKIGRNLYVVNKTRHNARSKQLGRGDNCSPYASYHHHAAIGGCPESRACPPPPLSFFPRSIMIRADDIEALFDHSNPNTIANPKDSIDATLDINGKP